jgi:hypothetical protein
MQRLFTQASKDASDKCLHISVTTNTQILFSFRVTWYSSPFLIDGGLKLLYVDALKWHSPKAKASEKKNSVGYSHGDPAPLVLMSEGHDEISQEEIDDLYEIVRYGKRSWPMGTAKVWFDKWLAKNPKLIGVDHFAICEKSF